MCLLSLTESPILMLFELPFLKHQCIIFTMMVYLGIDFRNSHPTLRFSHLVASVHIAIVGVFQGDRLKGKAFSG